MGNGDTVKKKRRKKRCPLRKKEQRDQMKAKKDDRRKKYDKAIAAYLRGKYDSYRSCAIAYMESTILCSDNLSWKESPTPVLDL